MSTGATEKSRLRRMRYVLGILTLVFFAAKAITAWRTVGTDDALFWQTFARTVRRVGPIDIYSQHLIVRYNHPPPIGWLLMGLNQLTDLGLPFRFLIRLPACLADVGSTFLVFELLRRRVSLGHAFAAAVLVAVNPVLFIISGFHGNTDAVLVFFVLLSVWLLADRDRPVWAALALAAALGVKLVPVVVIPAILAAGFSRGRRVGFRLLAAAAVAVTASWLPAVAREYPAMKLNVFGYGGHPGHWGVTAVLRKLGETGAIDAYAGPGRYLVLAAAALPAAFWAWRRPSDLPAATGLALVSFLALSPAWAPQYLAWTVAAGAVLSTVAAAVYSAVAGTMLVVLYTQWSHGFPWHWAHARPLTRFDVGMSLAAWLVVLAWTAVGLHRLLGLPGVLDRQDRERRCGLDRRRARVGSADDGPLVRM
jgi:4-amino-4-deoxy-L-arabinose transferase-like glycosyltransferase